MIFKNFDYLSPTITLYFKGNSIHPTRFSGILTIITYIVISAFGIFYLIEYIKKRDKKIYFFNRYVEDAGIFPLNSSSMFHFIQLVRTDNNQYEPIDFKALRIIGLEETIDNYMNDTNIANKDHWIYGACNNETDTKGIGHLITNENFIYSNCIKKFYSLEDRQYYDISNKKFRWPIIKHGCSNPNRTFYGIIVERCLNNSFTHDCLPIQKINEYLKHYSIVFQIIDHYPEMVNYKNPFIKYFYLLANGLFINAFTINHLNFNPAITINHEGVFFDNPYEEKAYIFTQNEKVTVDKGRTEIIVSFYFWMQNTMQYYERSYKKFQDLLSDIGGLGSILIDLALIINELASQYAVLLDTEELIFNSDKINFSKGDRSQRPSIFRIDDINYPPKKKRRTIIERHKSSICNIISKNEILFNRQNNEESKSDPIKMVFNKKKNNNESKNSPINTDNTKGKTERKLFFNSRGFYKRNFKNSYIENYKRTFSQLKTERNENNEDTNKIIKRKKFSIFEYIFYLMCLKTGNSRILYLEKFRTQVISEENIIQNHLDIYKLLKFCNIERHNLFFLKELENKIC